MIVRWSLGELPGVLADLGIAKPFLIASPRWTDTVDLPVAGRWTEVPSRRIEVPPGADGIIAIGGGSAIDTAKAASASSGLPVVSVPTTYSGAEWTSMFGVRTPDRHMVGGGGGAHTAGIVYDVALTLDLPRAETVGTAMNALAHCAEALYGRRSARSDEVAVAGARAIARWLPKVVETPHDVEARTGLLEGAAYGGEALALAGLALAHAIAQGLGGRYGLPHGALNALALAPALRFNEPLAPDAVAQFAAAMGTDDAAAKVEELARLGGFERLAPFGIPESDLPLVAREVEARPGNQMNPRPATATELEQLLRTIY